MRDMLLEGLDFLLVLGTELFQLFLLLRLGKLAGLRLQGEHWHFVSIKCLRHAGRRPGRGGLAPTVDLLRVQTPLTAVGAKSSLKNPPISAKMGQLLSPDARSTGAQRLPVLLRVD